MTSDILVTGGTGTLGRLVLRRLRRAPVGRRRSVSPSIPNNRISVFVHLCHIPSSPSVIVVMTNGTRSM